MEKLLGGELFQAVISCAPKNSITEIRLRIDKKIYVKTKSGGQFINFIAQKYLLEKIVAEATDYSLYAYEKEISEGYIPYKNGIRIGIVGNGRVGENNIIGYKEIFALNIRIPHQILDCPLEIMSLLENFQSTLIISPPYGGKTTLIREMARILSEKSDVMVIDERYELCGENCVLERGERCDIVQGVPKNRVFETAIRTMAPEIVVCDELFGDSDYLAVKRITLSGIKCLATFHCTDINRVPVTLKEIFGNIITLSSKPVAGSIVSICRGKNA